MTYKASMKHILLSGLLLVMLSQDLQAFQDLNNPDITRVNRNAAEITATEDFKTIIDVFFLAENAEEIEKMEIIDVSDNGFGVDDLLVIYPSQKVYILQQPPPEVNDLMRSWSIEEQRRDASNELGADYFYPSVDSLTPAEINNKQLELVQNSLIADLLSSLERNYEDENISLRFERNNEGFTFQMWDYNKEAFSFSPRPPAVSDSVAVNDFLFVKYSDSTVVTDTTRFDIMYLNKSIERIIYTPAIEEIEQLKQIQTIYLPDLRGAGRVPNYYK